MQTPARIDEKICRRIDRLHASTQAVAPPPDFARIEQAAAAIARGEMVVVVDSPAHSPARENEGDLVMAAENVTPQAINFMGSWRRGAA
jgi:3,4-dihydroxy-2-butanone 4-phosphate synthase